MSEVALWSMPAAEAGDVLVLLTQVRSQLDALQMRVLRHASSRGGGFGRRCHPRELVGEPDAYDPRRGQRTAHLAVALERHEAVADALARR